MGSNHHRADQDGHVGWSLRLRGVAALIDPGGGVHVLERRVAALLAVLAHEREVTRARAVTLLWPDAEPAQGRHALRQQLLRLRKLTGGDLVEGGQVLRLAAAVQLLPESEGQREPLLDGHEYEDSEHRREEKWTH